MASMKAVKPQGSSPVAPKIQPTKAGGGKPAPKKAVQKPQEPKVKLANAAPKAN